VIVPSGKEMIVVFGSSTDSLAGVSEQDMPIFGDRVARMVDHVPSAKRLADELEVLDAVRAITTVNAEGVEAALAEISERAATALSCEFGSAGTLGDIGAAPRLARRFAAVPARSSGTPS